MIREKQEITKLIDSILVLDSCQFALCIAMQKLCIQMFLSVICLSSQLYKQIATGE